MFHKKNCVEHSSKSTHDMPAFVMTIVMTRKCFALAKLNEDIMACPLTFICQTVGWNLVLRCKLWIYVRIKNVVVMVKVMGMGLGFVSDGLHKDGSTSVQVFSSNIYCAYILIHTLKAYYCGQKLKLLHSIIFCGMLGHQTLEHFDNGWLCACVCVLFIWGLKCNTFPSRLIRRKNTKH